MAQATTYKRSFSGSVGSGMKSIMGNGERRYYVLEHKVSTKYHKAGETQKIIVDQIELGRSPNCQVRFDESFTTVSRRHAAIVKDGDNWKLVQLSQTNSTYLNGVKVQKEWYLQSGDEIQLSTNGPKMGFIVPQGSKGLVKSIGMTARLNLFRQQALRPYKQAMTALACLLVLCIAGGAWVIIGQGKKIDAQGDIIAQLQIENARVTDDFLRKIREMEERRRQDSTNNARAIAAARREAANRPPAGGTDLYALIQQQQLEKDVYFLKATKVCLVIDGEEHPITFKIQGDTYLYGWTGTGFLLDDGRFVTARHCIDGIKYTSPSLAIAALDEQQRQQLSPDQLAEADAALMVSNYPGVKVKGYFEAESSISNIKFTFTSDDFVMDDSRDQTYVIAEDEGGNRVLWNSPFALNSDDDPMMGSSDWAYTTHTNGKRGGIKADSQLSQNLQPMQALIVLGFPLGLGAGDGSAGSERIQPMPTEMRASRQGLSNNGCILHNSGTDHGNSGGPVFALNSQNKFMVVGIVSRGIGSEYNYASSICWMYN